MFRELLFWVGGSAEAASHTPLIESFLKHLLNIFLRQNSCSITGNAGSDRDSWSNFTKRLFVFFRFTWKRTFRNVFLIFLTRWNIARISIWWNDFILKRFKLLLDWCNVVKKVCKSIRIMLLWFIGFTTKSFLMSCNTFWGMIAWLGIACTASWCHTNLLNPIVGNVHPASFVAGFIINEWNWQWLLRIQAFCRRIRKIFQSFLGQVR